MSDAPNIYDSAFRGDIEMMREILVRHPDLADAHSPIWENGTPLTLASYAGHLQIVCLLLDRGVNANSSCDDGSALLMAAFGKHVEVVKVLLDHDANPNLSSHAGETPLMAAVFKDSMEITELLLSAGAEINAQTSDGASNFHSAQQPVLRETALHLAAACGNLEMVQLLLSRGADKSIPDRAGQTPLHWAPRNKMALRRLLRPSPTGDAPTSA